MKTKKLLKKYFPDYKKKGLKKPKFMEGDKVTPLDEDDPGEIVDIDTSEKYRLPDATVEWFYKVLSPDNCYYMYAESKLKFVKD